MFLPTASKESGFGNYNPPITIRAYPSHFRSIAPKSTRFCGAVGTPIVIGDFFFASDISSFF